jgi:tetratricopeptide (TPR) repeat protein
MMIGYRSFSDATLIKGDKFMRRLLALSVIVLAFIANNAFAVGEARVNGKIFDGATKKPIPNPTVLVESADTAKNFKQEFKGKSDGTYAIFLLTGTIRYKFTYSAPGYAPYSQTLKLKLAPEPNVQDIDLSPVNSTAEAGSAAPTAQPTADPAILAYNEGANLANQGQVPEAIAKLEEAVTLKPDLTSGYIALARLYLRQKTYDKAIDRANKALAIDTDNMDMNAILFESYTATGDKAKAAEYKKKLPANPRGLFNEAAKLINANKDADAEPLLKQAIAADENFAVAYYELGMIYVRSGKNAEAKTNLQKYLELEPTGKDAATAKEMLKYVK